MVPQFLFKDQGSNEFRPVLFDFGQGSDQPGQSPWIIVEFSINVFSGIDRVVGSFFRLDGAFCKGVEHLVEWTCGSLIIPKLKNQQ